MREIKPLNKSLLESENDLEVMIDEMMEREEFACTGDACAGNACGIN